MAEPPILRQLPLAFRFPAATSFDNFIATSATEPVLHALRHWCADTAGGVFYLTGPVGSGRTHLLQAAARDRSGWYLPLAELLEHPPEAVLEGLDSTQLLCLDDVDSVVADRDWCLALFTLFNRLRDSGRHLLVSARVAPGGLACALPDLQSRLAWGGCQRLAPLDDAGRRRLLELRGSERGLHLSDEVISYLLSHFPRGTTDLTAMVEKLDDISLVRKQRITVPLVRRLLALQS